MRLEGIGIHEEGKLRNACSRSLGSVRAVARYPEVAAREEVGIVLFFGRREVFLGLHSLAALVEVQTRSRTYNSGIVVYRNLVVYPVLGDVIVLVVLIGTTRKSSVQNVLVLGGVLALGQTRSRSVVRIFYRILAVSDNVAPAERIVADDVLHLTERPFREGVVRIRGIIPVLALLVLVVDECGELHRGVVSRASPRIEVEIASGSHIGVLVHYRIYRLGFHFPEVERFILSPSDSHAGLLADLGIDVLYAAEYQPNAVPHIVPAEDVSGRRVVVDVLLARLKVVVVAGDKVEPARRKTEVVLPLAGGIEAHRSLTGRSDSLVVFVREVEESLRVVEALLGVFGVGILEVVVVDSKSRRALGNVVRCRELRGREECGTSHSVYLGRLPVRVVNASVADLIAERHNIAVLVAEGTAHKVVAEVAAYRLGVLVLTRLLVGVAELVISPRYHRSRISLGKSKLDVVARVVEAARNVDISVSVGVEDIRVLLHKGGRHIRARVIVVDSLHGYFCVVYMAVSAP